MCKKTSYWITLISMFVLMPAVTSWGWIDTGHKVVALIAWVPDKRIRIISIVVPILTFVQMLLPGGGRWVGALHPVNALLILGMYLWLFLTLRKRGPVAATETVAEPSG
jgi:hypothetical protein